MSGLVYRAATLEETRGVTPLARLEAALQMVACQKPQRHTAIACRKCGRLQEMALPLTGQERCEQCGRYPV